MHTQPKPGIAYPKTSFLLLLLHFSVLSEAGAGVGKETEFSPRGLGQGDPQAPSTRAVWTRSRQPSKALCFTFLVVGHCELNPTLRGARAGLLAHCTSLCIPSLFPMQIKLMRIRNIMEPIHRSSRWKMGLTTNFPLQLFCNYRGIL